jgi:hypothetical protein
MAQPTTEPGRVNALLEAKSATSNTSERPEFSDHAAEQESGGTGGRCRGPHLRHCAEGAAVYCGTLGGASALLTHRHEFSKKPQNITVRRARRQACGRSCSPGRRARRCASRIRRPLALGSGIVPSGLLNDVGSSPKTPFIKRYVACS